MTVAINRRALILSALALPLVPGVAFALSRDIWSADRAQTALLAGEIKMIDVRTRDEWKDTGIAQGAWPISMHEDRFKSRLLAARDLANGAPIALICAVGGRSGWLNKSLKSAGFKDFIDVSEGMMGSKLGPGWIARGLPIVDMDTSLSALPKSLV